MESLERNRSLIRLDLDKVPRKTELYTVSIRNSIRIVDPDVLKQSTLRSKSKSVNYRTYFEHLKKLLLYPAIPLV